MRGSRGARARRLGVVVVALALVAGCQGTSRVSRSSGDQQANGASGSPVISDDGRFVAFTSEATNLVPGDTNGQTDVFVRDRSTGATTRVNVSSGGVQANGRSLGDLAISGDGRFVAFPSGATNLVPGDTNGSSDVFVRDLQAGTTTLEGPGGGDPDLDDVGAFLAYAADGQVLLRDRGAGTTEVIPSGTQSAGDPSLSGDGRFVALLISLDPEGDVFVYDRTLRLHDRISYSGDNIQDPDVSDDGRTIAFWNGGNDRVLVSQGGQVRSIPGSPSYEPQVSADGLSVAYIAEGDLDDADENGHRRDAYLLDLRTNEVTYLSVGSAGLGGDLDTTDVAISGDGRYAAFASDATNLVDGDTNGASDIFVRDQGAESTSSG